MGTRGALAYNENASEGGKAEAEYLMQSQTESPYGAVFCEYENPFGDRYRVEMQVQLRGECIMSWLLFLDESGHDHKQMPYEVRGGVAIQDRRVWPFIRAIGSLEEDCFGTRLSEYRKEFKGAKLLDKDRMTWCSQGTRQTDDQRKRNARAFLAKGLQQQRPTRDEFTGYGQACYEMAQGIFRLLREHDAVLFASAIPRGIKPPPNFSAKEFLRKDHVFLLERFYYFLKQKQEQGLLVFDQVEEAYDMRFIRRMERYFTRTAKGAQRADWIVPVPLFCSSFLSIPIQVADVCIYCLNWGFRRVRDMNEPVRDEIEQDFAGWIKRLQFERERVKGDGQRGKVYGIVFVTNPYGPGATPDKV